MSVETLENNWDKHDYIINELVAHFGVIRLDKDLATQYALKHLLINRLTTVDEDDPDHANELVPAIKTILKIDHKIYVRPNLALNNL
jgi:hypothetical protein